MSLTIECSCTDGHVEHDERIVACTNCKATGRHEPYVGCQCSQCIDAWFILVGNGVIQIASDEFQACAIAGRISMTHPGEEVVVLDRFRRHQPFLFISPSGFVETREPDAVRTN